MEEIIESLLFVDHDGPLDESIRHIDISDGLSLLGRSHPPIYQLIPCGTDSSETAPKPMDLDRISLLYGDYTTLR